MIDCLGKKPNDNNISKNSAYFSRSFNFSKSILKSPDKTTFLFSLHSFSMTGLNSLIKFPIDWLLLLHLGGRYTLPTVNVVESRSRSRKRPSYPSPCKFFFVNCMLYLSVLCSSSKVEIKTYIMINSSTRVCQ